MDVSLGIGSSLWRTSSKPYCTLSSFQALKVSRIEEKQIRDAGLRIREYVLKVRDPYKGVWVLVLGFIKQSLGISDWESVIWN